jgi:flagellar protein FliL
MATSQQNAPKTAPPKGTPEVPEEDTPKPKKSKKKLVFIFVVLLLLGGGGGGAWWYFMSDDDGDKPESTTNATNATNTANVKTVKSEKPVAPLFLALEQFTVNLQPEAGDHYLQISMTLQLETKEDIEQIKLYMPQIRSRILMLLTSKKASEIATIPGKKKLSEEIMAQVNMPLTAQSKPQAVINVFFTSFVIQ